MSNIIVSAEELITLRRQLAEAEKKLTNQAEEIRRLSTVANERLGDLGRAQTKLSAAQAVIDKLPRTADGVLAFAGDMVWWFDSTEGRAIGCVLAYKSPGPGNWIHWDSVGECYSTRELAEAAQKEGVKK